MVRKAILLVTGMFVLTFMTPQLAHAEPMLTWDAVAGDVQGYKIYYGTSSGSYLYSKNVGNATQYSLANLPLEEGTTYYFVVRAYNDAGESENSSEASHTVPSPGDTTPPLAPQGVSASTSEVNITLNWQANTESDLSGYKVYYGNSSRSYGPSIPAGNVTGYTVDNLEVGKTYYLAVSALDSAENESGYSLEVVQTIPPDTGGAPPAGVPMLQWEPASGAVTGYKIYYGTSSGNYPNVIDVGNVTQCSLSDLSLLEGTTYYFISRAYSDAGESDNSNEVSYDTGAPPDPTCQLNPGDPDYCLECGPCTVGQGDCDSDSECQSGLECEQGAGPNYGWASDVDVCEGPPKAVGQVGNAAYCRDYGPCAAGQGDCDSDSECQSGLVCVQDVGFNYGWLSGIDVCESLPDTTAPAVTITGPTSGSTYETSSSSVNISGSASDNVGVSKVTWVNSKGGSGTANGTASWSISGLNLSEGENTLTVTAKDAAGNPSTDTLVVMYTPPAIPPLEGGHADFCRDYGPCTVGQGDCDSDSECQSGLECEQGAGPNYGWASDVDVCEGPPKAVGQVGNAAYCRDYGPCAAGQGDCDSDSECQSGLVCVQDVGFNYGWLSGIDVCESLPDTTAPAVTITGPTSGSTYETSSSSVNISGSASDNVGVSKVTWVNSKGGSGTANGTASWSISGLNLSEGENTLTVTAKDAVGNPSTDTLVVMYTPPAIPPLEGGHADFCRDYGPCTVGQGDCDSDSECQSGLECEQGAGPNYGWASDVDVCEGPPKAVGQVGNAAYCRDYGPCAAGQGDCDSDSECQSGLVCVQDVGFNYGWLSGIDVCESLPDTTAPAVTITGPTSGSTYETSSSSVNLSGSASDNVGVSKVTWVNSTGGSGTANGTASWSISGLNLSEGENTLTVTAKDAAGNQSTDTLTVAYTQLDTSAPTVSITSPTSGGTYETSSSSINVLGSASDNAGVSNVTWVNSKGGSGTASGTASWYISSINLLEGQNTLTVTAKDAAGNQSTDTLTVAYTPLDTTAPTVSITSPTSGSTYETNSSSINLSGNASDNTGVVQVVWSNSQGGSDVASGTTGWSITGVDLAEGANVITVTASDAAGSEGSRVLTVTYTPQDTVDPIVSITTPTSSSTYETGSASINVSGSASDNVGVNKVTWINSRGGSGTASGTSSWSISGISLSEGDNLLTVTAKDASGNQATDTLTVSYAFQDTTAPVITIKSPTTKSKTRTRKSSISLSGSASDNVGVTQVTWTNSSGGSGTASGTSSWSIANIPLSKGTNVLRVTAKDAAGNQSTDTLTVTKR